MKVSFQNEISYFDMLDNMGICDIIYIKDQKEEPYIITIDAGMEYYIIIDEKESFYLFDCKENNLSDILKNDFLVENIHDLKYIEEFDLNLKIRVEDF